jgi:hypothetical protein
MVAIGGTYPEICHPIIVYSGIISSGVKMASLKNIMTELHGRVCEKIKKNTVDDLDHDRFASSEEHL